MSKKKKNSGGNANANNNNEVEKVEEKKKGGDGGDKKEGKNDAITVVLKVEMHCEGCASKLVKIARGFEGVEKVKPETESNKLTVIGKVDPLKIQQSLHEKTKKKVDLVSPQPKKEDKTNNKDDKKSDDGKKSNEKKSDSDKKPKEPPVTTAVIKLSFHCQGCVEKIQRIVTKTKGVQEMAMDKQKETVTVKGTMDAKALTETLKERLKRSVEIVPAKKEKDGGGGEKGGENSGGGGKKKGGSGGGGQENGGGGGGGGDGGARIMEENRMEFMVPPSGFGPAYGYMGQPVFANGHMGQPVYANGYMGQPVYGNGYMVQPQPVYGYGQDYGYGYGQGQVPGYPAHMKFNDENPNSCSIM